MEDMNNGGHDNLVGNEVASLRQHGGEQSGATTIQGGEMPSEYPMTRDGSRVALIINNKFGRGSGSVFKRRDGTDTDFSLMKNLLTQDFGFHLRHVIERHDRSYQQMKEDFETISRLASNEQAECLVVIILSYGDEGSFYGTDKKMHVEELISHFKGDKCPSLAEKPKLFFLQTCKEDPMSRSVVSPQAEGEGVERVIPTESNLFIVHSCIKGSLSWLNDPYQGSLFISTLSEVMPDLWRQCDVLTMMTRVLKKLNSKLKTERDFNGEALPHVSSTLWGELYFKPRVGVDGP